MNITTTFSQQEVSFENYLTIQTCYVRKQLWILIINSNKTALNSVLEIKQDSLDSALEIKQDSFEFSA